ncbi:MAG TPA: guanylate kinase [Phycisphaerales bacterium]|nr:guanylate kinase [Phycisphaerales bacterium]
MAPCGRDGGRGGIVSGLLAIVSGPSGVGKTTITRAVVDRIDDAELSVSATTRPIRPGETEGVDYFFKAPEQFDEMVRRGELLEWADVFGNRYGTPVAWVNERLAAGRVVVLEIDVQGAVQVKRNRPDAFGVFILPPNEEALLDRLRRRAREGEDVIQRRFAEAKREIADAHASGAYDVFIVNDNLESAIDQAVRALQSRRGVPGGA